MGISEFQDTTFRNWHWRILRPDSLDGWFQQFCDSGVFSPESLRKQNPVRSVAFVSASESARFFAKLDAPKSFSAQIRARLRSKIVSEAKSLQLLREHRIPAVELEGFARGPHGQGILLTRALDSFLPAQQYWFETAHKAPEKRADFLQNVHTLIRTIRAGGIFHPDFHPGNVLVRPSDHALRLVDVYGVRRGSPQKIPNSLLLFFMELIADLTPAEVEAAVLATGLTHEAAHALPLWRKAVESHRAFIRRIWPKRRAQLLSGSSKFCRKITAPDKNLLFLRNSRWFTRTDLAVESLHAREFPTEAGTERWLDSFFRQLNGELPASLPSDEPLAIKHSPSSVTLFFARADAPPEL